MANYNISVKNSSSKDLVLLIPEKAYEATMNDTVESTKYIEAVDVTGYIKPLEKIGVIKAGESLSINLDKTYYEESTDSEQDSMFYGLIFSDNTYYEPLAFKLLEMVLTNDNDGAIISRSFDDVEIVDNDLNDLSLAKTFLINIIGNMLSNMASDFFKTLNEANTTMNEEVNSASSYDDLLNAYSSFSSSMDSFFKRYSSYNSINIDLVLVVQSYFINYPMQWAAYYEQYSYKIFGTDEKQIGTLILELEGNVDLAKDNGNYSCKYKGVDTSESVSLTYSSNYFINDANTIKIWGGFYPNQEGLIKMGLAGTIDGVDCLSSGGESNQNFALGDSSNKQYYEQQWYMHIQNALFIIGLTVGAGYTARYLYRSYKAGGALPAKDQNVPNVVEDVTKLMETIGNKISSAVETLQKDSNENIDINTRNGNNEAIDNLKRIASSLDEAAKNLVNRESDMNTSDILLLRQTTTDLNLTLSKVEKTNINGSQSEINSEMNKNNGELVLENENLSTVSTNTLNDIKKSGGNSTELLRISETISLLENENKEEKTINENKSEEQIGLSEE